MKSKQDVSKLLTTRFKQSACQTVKQPLHQQPLPIPF